MAMKGHCKYCKKTKDVDTLKSKIISSEERVIFRGKICDDCIQDLSQFFTVKDERAHDQTTGQFVSGNA